MDTEPSTNMRKKPKIMRKTIVVVSGRKRKSSNTIKVAMSLAPGSSVDDLVGTIEKFVAALGEVTLSLRLDNKQVDGIKLSQEIGQITSFFFQETFRSGARGRLISLVTYLEKASVTGDNHSTRGAGRRSGAAG